jgi:hypothetical protein
MLRLCQNNGTSFDKNGDRSFVVLDKWKKQLTLYDPCSTDNSTRTFSFDKIFSTDTYQVGFDLRHRRRIMIMFEPGFFNLNESFF